MCQTLPKRAAATISAERDCAKEHLCPSQHRVRPAHDPMRAHGPGPQRPFVDVQLEVHTESELRRDGQKQDVGERDVRAFEELPASVRVPEYVAAQCEYDACGLRRRDVAPNKATRCKVVRNDCKQDGKGRAGSVEGCEGVRGKTCGAHLQWDVPSAA